MHVIFMGPQGVGKGTQATRIAERLGLSHLSTGELFRAAIKAETPLGVMAKKILDEGNLVPDDITLGMVEARLEEIAAERNAGSSVQGALFDGFPRTIPQAVGLDAMLAKRGESLLTVIEITAPRDVLVQRLSGRRVCPNCGWTYHIEFDPPKVDSICDNCGHTVIQRDDDTPDAIEKRLSLYDEKTAPLLKYFADRGLLKTVDGNRDMDSVSEDLVSIIAPMLKSNS